MKLKELYQAYPSLDKFTKINLIKLDFNYPEVKSLMKLKKKIYDEIVIYEKLRSDLLSEYGEVDEKNPAGFKFVGDNLRKFQDANDILLENEIDIEYEKIKIKNPEKLLKLDISTEDMIQLELFFDME